MNIFKLLVIVPIGIIPMQKNSTELPLSHSLIRETFESKAKEKLGDYSKLALIHRDKFEKLYPLCQLYRYVDAYVFKAMELHQRSRLPINDIAALAWSGFPSSRLMHLITHPDPKIQMSAQNIKDPGSANFYFAESQSKGLLEDLERMFENEFTAAVIIPDDPK